MSSVTTHPDCFRLLRLLARGKPLPGSVLAAGLGCSLDALPLRLREAEELGVTIAFESAEYRLQVPLDLIDRDALADLLAPLRWPFQVEVLDECASTSTRLLQRTLEGAPHASVVVCEHQIAGRGRRGAEWVSALGGSLAFSLLWRSGRRAGELSGLSLAVAVGVARALESVPGTAIGLKWPNDLLLGDRKLGGILIEMQGSSRAPSAVVVGVGINVKLPENARSRINCPAADLAAGGSAPSRTLLLARLLENMAIVLDQFEREGFVSLREEWLARHAWQDKPVALNVADRPVAEGIAVGIAEDGALLLRSSRGLERYHAGELTLRRA